MRNGLMPTPLLMVGLLVALALLGLGVFQLVERTGEPIAWVPPIGSALCFGILFSVQVREHRRRSRR